MLNARIFDIEILSSTNNDKSYINIDIDSNLIILEKRGQNIKNLTNQILSKDWNDYQKYIYMEAFI